MVQTKIKNHTFVPHNFYRIKLSDHANMERLPGKK